MKKEFVEELIKRVLPSYETKEMLGEGSFGVVYRISDNLKERAVKIILLRAAPSIENGSVTSATKRIERDFRHIVESYEKIACEEIVTVYDFFRLLAGEDGRQATAYAIVVMELYPSNLFDYVVENFEKNEQLLCTDTAKNMMVILAYLLGNLYTKRGFLFEDLKPENILVKEQGGNLKLVVGDIGGLKSLGSLAASGSQVTLSYSAPEVLRKGQRPDLQSIIYSYGIISYFIFEGRLPYESHGVTERIDMIKDKGTVFDRKDVPHHLREVIGKCLAFDPENRYIDFNEIIAAIQEKTVYERNQYSHETIDLNSFVTCNHQNASPAREDPNLYGKTVFPVNAAGGLGASITLRTISDVKRRGENTRISDERADIKKVAKEIRDLVVRSGDVYKIQNESYKVFNDIKVESDAILAIENASLFFEENSGIMSIGIVRAKNSLFSAIDSSKKWKNIALSPTDTRINFIEGCKFSYGKGRTWESMKNNFRIRGHSLKDNYSYGGALFIAGIRDKIITIKDCVFHNCSAQEGGAIFCLKAQPAIENSVFDNCSAGLIGGGMCCVESNLIVRNCTLKNCSANKEGGGVSCLSSSPTVEGCTFDGCSTTYLYGGGIHCSVSSPVIKACKFNRCTASKDGGGIYFDADSNPRILYPAFTNCRPNNTNQADKGKSHFFFR
jgi:serine/threonine protein kinase